MHRRLKRSAFVPAIWGNAPASFSSPPLESRGSAVEPPKRASNGRGSPERGASPGPGAGPAKLPVGTPLDEGSSISGLRPTGMPARCESCLTSCWASSNLLTARLRWPSWSRSFSSTDTRASSSFWARADSLTHMSLAWERTLSRSRSLDSSCSDRSLKVLELSRTARASRWTSSRRLCNLWHCCSRALSLSVSTPSSAGLAADATSAARFSSALASRRSRLEMRSISSALERACASLQAPPSRRAAAGRSRSSSGTSKTIGPWDALSVTAASGSDAWVLTAGSSTSSSSSSHGDGCSGRPGPVREALAA
mmetsp:Transcript_16678/g.44622  ORF Transcript_16678/g.44622 Transcript_16678/m.44622 type:complete len:310 (-) Transcript_16678:48-977(-)